MMESSSESDDEILYPYDPEAPLVSADTFYYPVSLITNSISAAIQGRNFERAIQLINNGNELNLADNRGFTALHIAVQSQNLKVLDMLLQQPSIRKDVRSHRGETPLFISLAENVDDTVIIKLIESGCDVTVPNLENVTPLSLAVKKSTIDVAHLLIQKGANVDAKDSDGYTPLHNAVSASCYEAVCMLLYYNASVNEITSSSKVTPFMLAINLKNNRIAETLFNFVTDFNAMDFERSSTLYLALSSKSFLSKNILLECGSINNVEDNFLCLIEAMRWKKSSMFKHMFSNINHAELAHKRFFEDFIYCCNFSPVEFVECLYLIFSSEYAWFFIDKCRTIIPLIQKFHNEKINRKDRVNVLYLLFASGLEICFYEFWYIYRYFGFNEELESVFIAQPIIKYNNSVSTEIFHFVENSINLAWSIFFNYCGEINKLLVWKMVISNFLEILIDYLKFFTLAPECYYYIAVLPPNEIEKLVGKLDKRNIASLKELCRNKIRNVIISNKHAKDMYMLYDAIKVLPVPKIIKDILHLKRPLYGQQNILLKKNY